MVDYTMIVRGPYFEPWMSLSVQAIKRRDVMDRYRYLCAEHGVGMANKAIRVLSSIFNYGRAIEPCLEDWSNPVRVLAETRVKRQLKARTSFIPVDQLGKWLQALDEYRIGARPSERPSRREDVWLLLNLLLMTGLRSNEARSLRWTDVDLDSGTVTIRSGVAKNHCEVVLPLNTWLVNKLTNRSSENDGYVFKAPSERGYVGNLRRPLAELHQRSGLRITLHDLRRTFATYLDIVGTPFGVIKQLLNHVSDSDITAQYVQRRSVEEIRRYAESVHQLCEASRIPDVLLARTHRAP
jgi:integrase